MKTYATLTGPNGPIKLTFGIHSFKMFCKRMNCEPSIFSVFNTFQGGTKLDAICEIIRSGMEHTSVDNGVFVPVSEKEISDLLDEMRGPLQEGEKAMKAFISSIVNEDFDEWYENLLKGLANKSKEDEETDTDSKKKNPDE